MFVQFWCDLMGYTLVYAVGLWLGYPSLGLELCVWSWNGSFLLCSWARDFALTMLPCSLDVCDKWVAVNCLGSHKNTGVNLQYISILSREKKLIAMILVASFHGNLDELLRSSKILLKMFSRCLLGSSKVLMKIFWDPGGPFNNFYQGRLNVFQMCSRYSLELSYCLSVSDHQWYSRVF